MMILFDKGDVYKNNTGIISAAVEVSITPAGWTFRYR